MHFIILGPPGAGKGTQAKILSNKLNIPHLSTGEILRMMSMKQNEKGKKLKNTIKKGLLVSDKIISKVVKDRINLKDCNQGFILDGFPRTIMQANNFDSILIKKKIKIDLVIQINVSKDVLLKRIVGRQICKKCSKIFNKYFNPFPKRGCGLKGCKEKNIFTRSDDEKNAFKNVRLKKYEEESRPLLNYYKKKKILHIINGIGTSLEISKSIYKLVQGILKLA